MGRVFSRFLAYQDIEPMWRECAPETYGFLGGAIKAEQRKTRIVLQVGSELRIKDNGDIVIDNPELELDREDGAADAVLLYRFDWGSKEHILRLVDPVADHKHIKQHHRND